MADLARAAGVSIPTIRQFERGRAAHASTVEAIQAAFEKAGIIFIGADQGGPGARLRILPRGHGEKPEKT
jgi:transcriptional regulator with XRE-family HTH domain